MMADQNSRDKELQIQLLRLERGLKQRYGGQGEVNDGYEAADTLEHLLEALIVWTGTSSE